MIGGYLLSLPCVTSALSPLPGMNLGRGHRRMFITQTELARELAHSCVHIDCGRWRIRGSGCLPTVPLRTHQSGTVQWLECCYRYFLVCSLVFIWFSQSSHPTVQVWCWVTGGLHYMPNLTGLDIHESNPLKEGTPRWEAKGRSQTLLTEALWAFWMCDTLQCGHCSAYFVAIFSPLALLKNRQSP